MRVHWCASVRRALGPNVSGGGRGGGGSAQLTRSGSGPRRRDPVSPWSCRRRTTSFVSAIAINVARSAEVGRGHLGPIGRYALGARRQPVDGLAPAEVGGVVQEVFSPEMVRIRVTYFRRSLISMPSSPGANLGATTSAHVSGSRLDGRYVAAGRAPVGTPRNRCGRTLNPQVQGSSPRGPTPLAPSLPASAAPRAPPPDRRADDHRRRDQHEVLHDELTLHG